MCELFTPTRLLEKLAVGFFSVLDDYYASEIRKKYQQTLIHEVMSLQVQPILNHTQLSEKNWSVIGCVIDIDLAHRRCENGGVCVFIGCCMQGRCGRQ